MTTRTAPYLKFDLSPPRVGARGFVGFDSTGELSPISYRGSVGALEDYGQPYSDLWKGSITAGDELALFNAWLLKKRGQFKPTGDQRKVLAGLFEKIGQGNVCDNVVDYSNGDKAMSKPNDSYRRALWVVRPVDIDWESGRVKGGEDHKVVLPAS